MVKKTVNKSKAVARTARSFAVPNFSKPKFLVFKGDGHKEVGLEEPTWPTVEEQAVMPRFQRNLAVGHAFNWYTYTQTNKKSLEFVEEAMSLTKHGKEIFNKIKHSNTAIGPTFGWLVRMHQMGLVLSWSEKKFMAKTLRKLLRTIPKVQKASAEETKEIEKVTIQDRINAKLKITFAELDASFDDFIKGNFAGKNDVMSIFARTSPPGNRMKDIVAYAESNLKELRFGLTGVPPFDEAYASYGKRGLKAMIGWWEQVISSANSYGVIRAKDRKPRKKSSVTPEKLVSKLKFIRSYPELKLNSVPAVEILKSSEIWCYNTKTRKLGIYIADQSASALDVKGSRIMNIDPTNSVQKTLRKPEKQLKEFMSLGKPAAKAWFKKIKSTEVKMKAALSKDAVLLKSFK